jgi:sec-independent protein translocase protein TatA
MSSFLNNMLILGMGTGEIVVVALILLLLFGGKKIPELMRGLGRGVREFNDAKSGIKNEIQKGMNEEQNPESKN